MLQPRLEMVAKIAAGARLTNLLERAPAGPRLFVLNYHRIGEGKRSLYDAGVFSATADEFDAQVACLKSRYHIASLAEARDFVRRPKTARRSMLLITFDDGYIDNYATAFPILRSHGAPGVFFLATSYTGTRRLPWWDAIAFLLKTCGKPAVRLSYPKALEFALDGDINAAVRLVLRVFKSAAVTDPDRFLRELADACGMEPPAYAPERLFLNWDEAREMQAAGMDIGSHTHSHELLGKLPAARQVQEARLSGELIRRHLGQFPLALAYPVGKPGSFTAETFSAMETAGYELAFSFYGGVNRPGRTPCYDVRRAAVEAGESLAVVRFRAAVATRMSHSIE
jgi:peptidoglycan/xylan/chitin deacetylase (PgdA/CDA1 family)